MSNILKVEYLFPTHVLVTDQVRRPDTPLVLNQQEQDFIDECCNNTFINSTISMINHHNKSLHDSYHRVSKNRNLLHHPSMIHLYRWLKEWASSHIRKMYNAPKETSFDITQSWLTVTSKEHYASFPHVHSNSFMSGVLYIQANREYDSIEFTRSPNTDRFKMEITDQEINPTALTMENHYVPVHTGDILLFSSHTTHRIYANPSNPEPRISLAFNVLPSGVIGFYDQASQVNITVT